MKYLLLVVKRNGVGKSKDKEAQVKMMNNKEARSIFVITHPRKNISTMREYKEEDVRKEKKNCNTRLVLRDPVSMPLRPLGTAPFSCPRSCTLLQLGLVPFLSILLSVLDTALYYTI